jgi:hypothetical protein
MKRTTGTEIIFGLLALALIYIILNSHASITGFVISPGTGINLVSPADDTTTTATTNLYFIFSYPEDFNATECSLFVNDKLAKRTTGLLSPTDTRMRVDLSPNTYYWKVQCKDDTGVIMESSIRVLTISPTTQPSSELKKTKFPGRAGYLYEFTLRDDLELIISNVVPNDVIRAKKGENSYDMSILRIIKDYETGLAYCEILVTPGDKRVRIDQASFANLDFNNDGSNDLKLSLDQVLYGKAQFTASTKKETPKSPSIQEPSITISPVTQPGPEAPSILDQVIPSNLLELIIAGMVVAMIIAGIAVWKNKSDSEKHYVSGLRNKPTVTIPVQRRSKKKAAKKKPKPRKKGKKKK